MRKILITGADSYIGTSFEKYIHNTYPKEYVIDTVDLLDNNWKKTSFIGYDSVFHVAGIAHSDSGSISVDEERNYYTINTDLAVEVAEKSKKDGVKQFVFMSSIILYGDSAPIGEMKIITKDTPLAPANCYSDSKAQAEKRLQQLENSKFKVVILRPPMIYGQGSKGNYPLLVKIAKFMPVFPYVENQRSMLYIDNFCEFVHLMIINEERGIFYPQNQEYSNTSELVKMIAQSHGKRIFLVKGFGWLLKLLGKKISLINKAFGSLKYEQEMSSYRYAYQMFSLKQSIEKTES